MTFEEIDQELPNGFHDAKLRNISIDFVGRSVVIGIDLLVGLPHTPNPEGYRAGALKVASSCLFFVEAPDPSYPFIPDGSALNVDGDSVRAGQSAQVDELLLVLPKNATLYRFFLKEWNSFLYLGGASVEVSWDDDGTSVNT